MYDGLESDGASAEDEPVDAGGLAPAPEADGDQECEVGEQDGDLHGRWRAHVREGAG